MSRRISDYLFYHLNSRGVDIIGLSERTRPCNGEISSGCYAYYRSGLSDDARLKGVAISISDRLQSSVVGVAPVDERMMLARVKHTVRLISFIAVHVPTEMCELEEKEILYAILDSIVDQCPPRDTLVVLGDFNTVAGTERDDYELYIGPLGSGTRNVYVFFFLLRL